MRGKTGILTVLVALLSACATPSEPETLTPLASPSVSTSTRSDVVQPSSEPARERELEPNDSVASFVAEYMHLVEESVRSREALETRRSMYAPSCALCLSGAEVAEQVLGSGLQVRGGEVDHTLEVLSAEASVALASVTYSIAPIELLDGNGQVVESAAASGPTQQAIQIARQEDGSWLILSIDELG